MNDRCGVAVHPHGQFRQGCRHLDLPQAESLALQFEQPALGRCDEMSRTSRGVVEDPAQFGERGAHRGLGDEDPFDGFRDVPFDQQGVQRDEEVEVDRVCCTSR
ncbi:hypothetical protein Q5530_16780 [Saccharothrix sp. BKS2]|uniref:hypothetical protein n=1 Tax=Saccharothrix sp. BKS2 TaxID=3064400 RepID=UPI0039E73FD0